MIFTIPEFSTIHHPVISVYPSSTLKSLSSTRCAPSCGSSFDKGCFIRELMRDQRGQTQRETVQWWTKRTWNLPSTPFQPTLNHSRWCTYRDTCFFQAAWRSNLGLLPATSKSRITFVHSKTGANPKRPAMIGLLNGDLRVISRIETAGDASIETPMILSCSLVTLSFYLQV